MRLGRRDRRRGHDPDGPPRASGRPEPDGDDAPEAAGGRADGRGVPIRDPAAARPGRPGRGLRRLRPGAAPRGRPQGDPPDRADDGESRARFVLEAEITGSLEHPGIVPVYGLGEFGGGRPFYAMRFVQGDSLKAAIERFHAADGPGRDPGERALALRDLLRRFIDRLQCDRLRAQPRRAAPRHQAGQRHAGEIRRDPGRGLGVGQGDRPGRGRRGDRRRACPAPALGRRLDPDGRRVRAGDAGLHEPRAGRRRARPARPAVGHL